MVKFLFRINAADDSLSTYVSGMENMVGMVGLATQESLYLPPRASCSIKYVMLQTYGEAYRFFSGYWWPIKDMSPYHHEFSVGDEVVVTTDTFYARRKVSVSSFLSSMFGTRGRIVEVQGDTYRLNSSLGEWMNGCLLIPNIVAGQAPVDKADAGNEEEALKEALYDYSIGKGGDVDGLLRRYRELTGRDRPGFMS